MLTSVPIIDHVWESVGWWLKVLLIIAVSCVLLAKSVKYVNQDELGLRHLRGKVRPSAKPITPGWAFHVPVVGGVLKKSVLPQTWQLGVLVPKEGRTWDANYSITFVINPALAYKSWYGHQDPDEYLRTICTSWLWHVLKGADENPDAVDYAAVLMTAARETGLSLIVEPGRTMIGAAGLLLARVVDIKPAPEGRQFVVIDASMTELIRPALYGAFHRILPVRQNSAAAAAESVVDIVGPVCETSDTFGVERTLPAPRVDDLVAIMDAGAYGVVMSSNYNRRPMPPEVLVDQGEWRVIRRRQTVDDMVAFEA